VGISGGFVYYPNATFDLRLMVFCGKLVSAEVNTLYNSKASYKFCVLNSLDPSGIHASVVSFDDSK